MQSFGLARDLGLLPPIGPSGPVADQSLLTWAMLTLAALETGDAEQADAALDELAAARLRPARRREPLRAPRSGMLVEVAAHGGRADHADALAELLEPFRGSLLTVVLGLDCTGAADRYLAHARHVARPVRRRRRRVRPRPRARDADARRTRSCPGRATGTRGRCSLAATRSASGTRRRAPRSGDRRDRPRSGWRACSSRPRPSAPADASGYPSGYGPLTWIMKTGSPSASRTSRGASGVTSSRSPTRTTKLRVAAPDVIRSAAPPGGA